MADCVRTTTPCGELSTRCNTLRAAASRMCSMLWVRIGDDSSSGCAATMGPASLRASTPTRTGAEVVRRKGCAWGATIDTSLDVTSTQVRGDHAGSRSDRETCHHPGETESAGAHAAHGARQKYHARGRHPEADPVRATKPDEVDHDSGDETSDETCGNAKG